MRAASLLIIAFVTLGATEKSQASIYPFALGGSAQIVGTLGDPIAISVVLLSFTPGIAEPSYAYNLTSYYLVSQGPAGNIFSEGSYGVTYVGDPDQPRGGGTFATTVLFNEASVDVSDSARFLVSLPYFAHGFGFASGNVSLGLALPEGLSVIGEELIVSTVPEASTWAMLLIGFAGIVFAAGRRRLLSRNEVGIQTASINWSQSGAVKDHFPY
jgi:hypothetical protein